MGPKGVCTEGGTQPAFPLEIQEETAGVGKEHMLGVQAIMGSNLVLPLTRMSP